MPGQPMALQQQIGQPQFLIQQPFGGQQYATFPQFAYTNQQGQLVLQPAQFALPGQPGQPQGQQVILTGVPQKQGQPQMISGPGNNVKGGQPNYTFTSTGQLQMSSPGPQPQQTFMITNPLGPGIQGAVSMQGPGMSSQPIPTSMTGMKDGKPMSGPPQMAGQSNSQQPQQYVIPSPHGMTYMQHPPIIQNGQIIFRAPGPGDQQQVMFSPSAQPHPQAQPQVQHQPVLQGNPTNPMGGMQVRPPMPSLPPPGKTAISRAIAPLLPSVSQSNARLGYNGNQGGQPSPKSKQKMSPRSGQAGMGRPPAPKGGNMKMIPRMGGNNSPMPGSPGSPQMMPGSPRPQLSAAPSLKSMVGPPNLPMMGSEPSSLPAINIPSTTISMSQMSKLGNQGPPTSAPPTSGSLDPPTLTKEIMTPMPNLGQPNHAQQNLGQHMLGQQIHGLSNLSQPNLGQHNLGQSNMGQPNHSQPNIGQINHGPPNFSQANLVQSNPPLSNMNSTGLKPMKNFSPNDGEQGLVPTPKAVVKPQVLTHVIDGQVIKESSQPFPVSPVKGKNIFKLNIKENSSIILLSIKFLHKLKINQK